jgi:DNA-directed RNA polymerase specialized sigma24 family protein
LSKDNEAKEITAEKFANFLRWLHPVSELAGEEYERLRFRLVTFFSHRNCRFPDELVDETINRVCLKIGEEQIQNKVAFVYGFAKNVFLESTRKEKHHVNIDEISVASPDVVESTSIAAEVLDKCLGELSAENRTLILDYYSEQKQAKIDLHKQLTERLKTTQTALRMRVVRIKQTLKNCLQECMA